MKSRFFCRELGRALEMRHECSCTENEYSLSDEEEETWKVGGNSQSKDFAPNKEEAECNAFSLTEDLLIF